MSHLSSAIVLLVALLAVPGARAQTAFLPFGPVASGGGSPPDILGTHLDADGRIDLVMPVAGQATVFGVQLSTGPMSWTTVTGSVHAERLFAAGDVDGDGKMDLVARLASALVTLLGDGAGRFYPPIASPIPGIPSSVALADLDNDGHLDAVGSFWMSNAAGEMYHIGRGTGSGVFLPWPLALAGVGPAGPLSVVDREGDGDLDVFWAGSGAAVFLDGDGQGNLTVGAPIVLAPPVTTFAVARDLDSDGIADLAYLTTPARVAVARGLPGGAYAVPVLHPLPPGFQPGFLRAADLDGDSRPDLVVSGSPTPTTLRLLVLFGTTGGFGLPGPLAAQMSNLSSGTSFEVLDIDQDADLDVVHLTPLAAAHALLNLQAGVPIGVSAPFGPGCTSGAPILQMFGPPLVGQAVQLRTIGAAPGGNGLLIVGGTPAVARVGSCFLGVDPYSAAILLPHAYDGGGQSVIPASIPADPALQGTRWYLQDWVSDPLIPWWYAATNGLMAVIG